MDNNKINLGEDNIGASRPSPEEITNNTMLPAYEKRGIDTSPVRNGTLTLEEFERGIKNQEIKETFLFASIVIIIILLIAILNKKK